MKITTYKCDRCGKEVDYGDLCMVPVNQFTQDHKDVCESCKEDWDRLQQAYWQQKTTSVPGNNDCSGIVLMVVSE
ncbi:hypothetical protein [Methanolobus sp. WCC5]|uniref:hypothetical protein n=1 Tax=Methanolobus sp. WCC5 TaxID=3125785 RepID=UPI0032480EA7